MVISKLPRAGLGNKLFVWAHGVVFAHNNKMQHITIGWLQIMIGPILRGEKSLRFYNGFFKNDKSKFSLWFLKKSKYVNLSYKECNTLVDQKNNYYFFSEVPHWKHYFEGLTQNRDLIIDIFFKTLQPNYSKIYQSLQSNEIAVHIRMGDFKPLGDNEDFAKAGLVRTPLHYFIEVINGIREITKQTNSVTVFSNGTKQELKEILELPKVTLAENNNDLVDLLHMSKSKVIVLSAASTFGQWAGFLSNAILLHHPNHFHSYIRNQNEITFEGKWDENNTKLIESIKSLN
jgi:hypothetical protein